MAMERQYVIREAHTRSITAVGYNPIRREVLVGCEDGVIKWFEAENGKLTATTHEHRGWITDFFHWADQKLMLSSANDGLIIAWTSGGQVFDTIPLRSPVYSMAMNPRKQQLICGMKEKICTYDIDLERASGHIIDALRPAYTATEHKDIVRAVVCHESRVYSVGYDARLIIYDSSYTGDKRMVPLYTRENAHDAGIVCLLIAKDLDNTWIITGSFDKTVKIWSVDGKLVHKLEGFTSAISGVCYIPRSKTVWVASGAPSAQMFDPKSGDNISDYIGSLTSQDEDSKFNLQQLKFIGEANQLIGSTSRRQVVVWRYNASGCITALRGKSPVESITYTKKRPILIFTGDHDGAMCKWEQMQSNTFMYSSESYAMTELMLKRMRRTRNALSDKEKLDLRNALNRLKLSEDEEKRKQLASQPGRGGGHGAYSRGQQQQQVTDFTHPHKTILAIVYVEELDTILAASEDNNIYGWGYDDSAVEVLQNMKPAADAAASVVAKATMKFGALLAANEVDSTAKETAPDLEKLAKEEESASNRVAGFVCKYILCEHTSCVTCICIIEKKHGFGGTFAVSGGWDHRLCIWNVDEGRLVDVFHDGAATPTVDEPGVDGEQKTGQWAADGIITSIAYNPIANEVAYGSSDGLVHLRKFSLNGASMPIVNTLHHDAEVTSVKWNPVTSQWVTGCEDGIIKIWAGDGLNDLVQALAEKSAVTCLCVDLNNGSILVGLQNVIKVFENEKYRLVQSNVGHTDSVRDVIHIPERGQYISCSWDRTVHIWNEWKKPKKKQTQDIVGVTGRDGAGGNDRPRKVS